MKDAMGDRMKEFYEQPYRMFLTRRTPVIIRIDGKAFHSFTKKCGFVRPFDDRFIDLMNETAKELCKQIQGTKCAYVQSDEISILITDYDDIKTDAWFGYNVQKMTSISASIATSAFIKAYLKSRIQTYYDNPDDKEYPTEVINIDVSVGFDRDILLPNFDARVFNIPAREISNYFLWRQQDAVRNSIQAVAQSLYSHNELHGADSNKLQEMIFQKGVNWNDYDYGKKRGRFIIKQQYEKDGAIRNKWDLVETPLQFSPEDFKQWF